MKEYIMIKETGNAPITVVELVRCKDCKHSCDYTDIYPDHAYKCTKNGGYHNDSWFCADGDQKKEECEVNEKRR